jgi:hypothetical protein
VPEIYGKGSKYKRGCPKRDGPFLCISVSNVAFFVIYFIEIINKKQRGTLACMERKAK